MSIHTVEKKLTLAEHLTKLNVDLDREEIIWLAGKVAQEHRKRYPDEPLKKVYRPNHKGKSIAVGWGYDDRVTSIIDDLINI